MDAAALILLAFSMSMDGFAAALGKGAALHRPPLNEVLRTGAIFGLVEAATPLIGWLAGAAASGWISAVDDWIAFGLLALLGLRMLHRALRGSQAGAAPSSRHPSATLALAALATSLDGLVVGVTLALLKADILPAAATVGLATFLMASCGTLIGRWIGPAFGRAAEAAGGLCLIGVGAKIALGH